ncbi:MAG: alpha/beta fold hydrolase [Mangrovibacterium sp.]
MRIIFQILTVVLFASCANESKKLVYDFSPLDRQIQLWLDSAYYNSGAIAVYKDNELVYQKCCGDANGDTPYYIASAGKWLAAATVASVVETTDLEWTSKVKEWLPEFEDIKGEATLEQLFSHTAGYPDYQPKGNRRDDYQTLEEAVKHIVPLPADTTPGSLFQYGGLAMQVAGRMAEIAEGKDFETIFQERICKPMGMMNTHFTPVDSTSGHNPMIGGGAVSTLNDYTKFLSMIANDGMFDSKQILMPKSIAYMEDDHVHYAQVLAGEYVEKVRASEHKSIYGIGQWREELNDKGEAILMSSPSWAGAYPWIDKTTNTYGFFITHVNVGKANKDGFSSFLSSPVIPYIVRDIYRQDEYKDAVKTGYLNLSDAKIYYEEKGEGEPVIFIHGHSFDCTEWDKQFFEFSEEYRTIRYDCRGYGRSSDPEGGKDFMHINDLIVLMDSLEVEKAHLVGLSMGGFITVDAIALHQDRLLSATLASGDIFPVEGPSTPWTQEGIERCNKEIEDLKQLGLFNQKLDWYHGLVSGGGANIDKTKNDIWNMIYRWRQWQPLNIEPRLVLGLDAIDILKGTDVEVPILILTGDVDKDRKNALMECIPSAQQRIIPNAGHVSNMENPEKFNRELHSFLKGK